MRLTPLQTRYSRGPLRAAATSSTLRRPTGSARPWYTIQAAATTGGRALIDIYGEIGFWGIEAATFVSDLRQIDATELEIHLNSPGGDVYEGLAIYTALVDHPAHIEMRIDGLAASIASVIAQAGDQIIMAPNSEMMIHDAWGLTVGNAADHRRSADDLDRVSDNIASVYATRAGTGTTKSWRKTMEAETWFSASEAVAAGLADEVTKTGRRGDPPAALWQAELTGCRYLGRSAAPAPQFPTRNSDPDSTVPDGPADSDPVDEGGQGDVDAPGPAPAGQLTAPDPDPDPEPLAVDDLPVALTAGDVLAILAGHHNGPQPLVATDTVTLSLDIAAATITADPPTPVPAPTPPAPAVVLASPPVPATTAPVSSETVTAATAAAATSIVPDRSAEWVLAATKAAAALPVPDLADNTADQPNHREDIRRNYLEVLLP